MKVERRKCRLRRMMHFAGKGDTKIGVILWRYEGVFENVLFVCRCEKDSRESWESNRFPEEKR